MNQKSYVFSKPMRITFLLLVAGLCCVQCASSYRAQNEAAAADVHQAQIDPSFRIDARTDRMTIRNVEQNGDILILNVSYSGGCKEHDFDLVSNGVFRETYPPELEIKLLHDSHQDACRGVIDKKLYFNIEPFQYVGTSQVLLVLKNTDKTLTYTY